MARINVAGRQPSRMLDMVNIIIGIVIVVMAVMVAFVIIAVILPIYLSYGTIGGSY